MNEDTKFFVEGRKFNWTQLYGKLDEGKYEFILSEDDMLTIRVQFTIDENGKISYDNPTFE